MKGILKKTAPGSSSGRRARWNEDNLEANEVIKSDLNPTKIDEPKTPYWSALDIDVGTSGASWTCDTQFAGAGSQAICSAATCQPVGRQ